MSSLSLSFCKQTLILVAIYLVGICLPVTSLFAQTGELVFLSETADGEGAFADAHKVQAGETLYSISRMYDLSVSSLKALNGLENNIIHIGQRLIIGEQTTRSANQRKAAPVTQAAAVTYQEPAPEPTFAEEATDDFARADEDSYLSRRQKSRTLADPIPTGEVVEQRTYHEVKADESIYTIAEKYSVLVAELREWNALSDVRSGQTIVVNKTFKRPESTRAATSEALPNLSLLRNEEVPSRTLTVARTTDPSAASPTNLSEMNARRAAPNTRAVKEGTTSTWEFGGSTRSLDAPERLFRPSVAPAEHPLGSYFQEGAYAMLEGNPAIGKRFYAVHKDLPEGTRLNIDLPNNEGFLEVEVIGKLARSSKAVIGLSPASVRMLHSAGTRDKVRFYFSE